jgi:hypothetical protein
MASTLLFIIKEVNNSNSSSSTFGAESHHGELHEVQANLDEAQEIDRKWMISASEPFKKWLDPYLSLRH